MRHHTAGPKLDSRPLEISLRALPQLCGVNLTRTADREFMTDAWDASLHWETIHGSKDSRSSLGRCTLTGSFTPRRYRCIL